jgi:beta-phosphoglucomutase
MIENLDIKACIFDLDGVIVDTAKYHFIAWREIARELGFEFTEAHNERLKGVSRMRSLEILLEVGGVTLDQKTKERLAEKKNNEYVSYILQMTPNEILPGAKEFLDELRYLGVKTALGSASKNAITILNRLRIAHLFDAIIDGNKVTKAKPDPEIFLKGAEELNVSPVNCVVFEDAEAGIEAAIAARMKCVGIGNPQILGKANLVIPGFEKLSFNQLNKLLK